MTCVAQLNFSLTHSFYVVFTMFPTYLSPVSGDNNFFRSWGSNGTRNRLKDYPCALIVISNDDCFLSEIEIETYYEIYEGELKRSM
ncbi:MAG: hypothetical protein Q8K60_07205 [Parachlamydiaceae bacterium]|nr:hypothetical protein [Parachlamydiaceae bacterium]